MVVAPLIAPAAAWAVQPPTAGQAHVSFGSPRTIWSAAAGERAGFPAVFDAGLTQPNGTRTSRLMLTYGTGTDAPGQNPTKLIESTDGGTSWAQKSLPAGSASVNNMVRLANSAGTLIGVDFEPIAQSLGAADPNPSTPQNEANLWFRRWSVAGSAWTEQAQAKVLAPSDVGWLRFHRGILLMPDGKTLVGSVYGADNGGNLVAVVRSTDDGATWSFTKVANSDLGEMHLSFASDDRLIAWIRHEVSGDWKPDIYYSVSSTPDGSGSWSTPLLMSSDTGNNPDSTLLANGAALMGSGRTPSVLRYNYSGQSAWSNWTGRTTIYANQPTGGTAPRPLEVLGTSHTIAVVPTGLNTALAFGDNCGASWSCPTTATGYPRGTSSYLWTLPAEVNTDQWGTLDLATKFRRGEISFPGTTFVSYGDPASPRTSIPAYAFDGDLRNDSSVVTSGRVLTLKLDRAYDLTGIGAYATLRGSADLSIQTSTDGSSWSTPARGARSGIVRPFTTPVHAQYLRISDPNTGSSTIQTFLNELQVYTTSQTFEQNALGSAPLGNGLIAAQTTQATVVASAPVSQWVDPISNRLLELKDTSSTALARIAWSHGTSTSATFEFKARASGTPTKGLLLSITATNNGAAALPYHFWIDAPSGNVYRYTPGTASWGAPIGTLPANVWSWNTYSISVSPTAATFTQNGTVVGTTTPGEPFTALTGNELASTGSDPVGDDWYFDDISYTRP